jgi:DNA-binding transcriptional LysR family regulator
MLPIGKPDGRADMETAMELYQLKTFVTIARTGNLTRAAEALGTSQPAVSAQIKALEGELGVTLFARTPQGMRLTEAGRLLRGKAEEVSGCAGELLALARTLAGRPVGACRIGLNTEAGVLRIPELIEEMSCTAPGVRLELVQGVTRSILQGVAEGTLDAGFVFGPQAHAGLTTISLCRMELVIAAPASLKEKLKGTPLSAILREAWVWPPLECPFHEKALSLFRKMGGTPPAGVTADDESTILRLVRAGVGLSLLPAYMLADEEARGGCVSLRGTGSDIELAFLFRTRDSASPLLLPVLDALCDVWQISLAKHDR